MKIRLQNWFHKYNAWSFTKHRLWNDCKLAYYFSYIGTALRNSRDLNINELKSLKKLDSKFVLKGKIIHEVIESQLDQFRTIKEVDEKSAINQFINILEDYRQKAETHIVEYFNGQSVDQRFFDRIREDGIDQLDLFFGVIWPELNHIKYLRHEQFDRFNPKDDIAAVVKVDYVGKSNDDIVSIFDWKTGIDDPEYESNLQIGAYVLWAIDYYNITAEMITSNLVYLTTGKTHQFQFSEDELDKLKALIIAEFSDMNASYSIDRFDPQPEKFKCQSCHFSTVCTHSMAP